MAKLVLLTGLPGIGKTTVVERLAARHPRTFTRIHFGGLLRDSVERRLSRDMTHDEFRARFAEILTYADIEAATVAAREQADRAETAICLLDSHAVTPTDVGLRVTPDTPERIAILRFAGLVHISSDAAVERVRSNGDREGRRALSVIDVARAEALQLGVVTLYSSLGNCPLIVISGAGSIDDVADGVERAARTIQGD